MVRTRSLAFNAAGERSRCSRESGHCGGRTRMADGDDIFEGGQLRRELMLEVTRLNGLAARFYDKALDGDGDVASGTLYVKISERKSTLLGLNAPQSHAVQVIHEEQRPRQLTSTERAREV